MRISFNESDAEHLYELSSEHFVDGCYHCEKLKKRLEKFIGKKTVRHTKRILKRNGYCDNS